MSLTIAISPQGHLHLEESAETGAPSAVVQKRVRRAFDRGLGAGLEHLGSVEADSELSPPLAMVRQLARLYFAKLSRVPDLATSRELPKLDPINDELKNLIRNAPPMRGAEYLSIDVLVGAWAELDAHLRESIRRSEGSASAYLQRQNPALHQLGHVTFHLAELKDDEKHPFAFMATWTNKMSTTGEVQHQRLVMAMQQNLKLKNRETVVTMLSPVHLAAEQLQWVDAMLNDKSIFDAVPWTPAKAFRFLKDIPVLEACGLMVRVPDWWSVKRPARPVVNVQVGNTATTVLGAEAMLDFSVAVTLEGQDVTAAELKTLLAAEGQLVQLRGKWVQVDADKLKQALDQWKQIEREAKTGGITFAEGMRLLAGAKIGEQTEDTKTAKTEDWVGVQAGPWLTQTLQQLRDPSLADPTPPTLNATLRPYQQKGVHWLRFMSHLRLGACLADDMGLGKTIQVIALLLHGKADKPSLLVVPTSLISNWKSELAKFAPTLKFAVAHPSEPPSRGGYDTATAEPKGLDLVITTYGMLTRDEAIRELDWQLVILDEAQAIKNSGTRQTKIVKQLKAVGRIALTGTPVENRLSDLWSLFDFLNPGLLGSAADFTRYVRAIEKSEKKSYAPLRELVSPYILRRLKTDRTIISDLPDKTEMSAWCGLSKHQAVIYQQSVEELAGRLKNFNEPAIARRGLVLSYLMRFKQICNHPSQFLGDGLYAPDQSGKFARLAELCEELAERQEKVLVFTQFREMTGPLALFLETLFGRPGLVLHGGTSVPERRRMVEAFQEEDGPPFFVLSLKAGGTGLNLTQASQVIHFDRWWNPAVETQATDRAFRIGQKRNVVVHKFVCRGTVEERIDELIAGKRGLSEQVLSGGAEQVLTELDDSALLKLVSLDLSAASAVD